MAGLYNSDCFVVGINGTRFGLEQNQSEVCLAIYSLQQNTKVTLSHAEFKSIVLLKDVLESGFETMGEVYKSSLVTVQSTASTCLDVEDYENMTKYLTYRSKSIDKADQNQLDGESQNGEGMDKLIGVSKHSYETDPTDMNVCSGFLNANQIEEEMLTLTPTCLDKFNQYQVISPAGTKHTSD